MSAKLVCTEGRESGGILYFISVVEYVNVENPTDCATIILFSAMIVVKIKFISNRYLSANNFATPIYVAAIFFFFDSSRKPNYDF